MKSFVRRLAAGGLVGMVLLVAASAAQAKPFNQDPILFVHGIEGSGAQFESQKMRFMSNGYPEQLDRRGRLQLHARGRRQERSRSADRRRDRRAQAADRQVQGGRDRALARHLGDVRLPHERGHRRAAAGERRPLHQRRRPRPEPRRADARGMGGQGHARVDSMAGAQNVTIPNQTHVQTCTSAESFVEYYKFLTGTPPGTRHRPAERARYEVAGKALNFPRERGAVGRDRSRSGRSTTTGSGRATRRSRRSRSPTARRAAAPGVRSPSRPASGTSSRSCAPALPTLHIYYEPFVRSDYTLRLLAVDGDRDSTPATGPAAWRRSTSGTRSSGATRAPRATSSWSTALNICTADLCPISKQVNAFFAFDRNRDGQTDLSSSDPGPQ